MSNCLVAIFLEKKFELNFQKFYVDIDFLSMSQWLVRKPDKMRELTVNH